MHFETNSKGHPEVFPSFGERLNQLVFHHNNFFMGTIDITTPIYFSEVKRLLSLIQVSPGDAELGPALHLSKEFAKDLLFCLEHAYSRETYKNHFALSHGSWLEIERLAQTSLRASTKAISRPGDFWDGTTCQPQENWADSSPLCGKYSHLLEYRSGNHFFLGPYDHGQVSRDLRSVGCQLTH